MRASSMREVGALVRVARKNLGWTQADLAERLGVSRDWVVRLEQGNPRAEAQKVLDALAVLGVTLDARANVPAGTPRTTKSSARSAVAGRYVTKQTAARSPRPAKGKDRTSAKPAPQNSRKPRNPPTDPFDFLTKGA